MLVNIDVSKKSLKAIKKLNKRYFFDLFAEVSKDTQEEFEFRDAIKEIAEIYEVHLIVRNAFKKDHK